MYNDIFAIDEIPFEERQNLDEQSHPYLLKNYLFFGSKLDPELYYNYFLRTILFDIDIMEFEDFICFQHNNCQNPEKFLRLLELKVLPDIDKINSNSGLDGALEYPNVIKLKYGFIETENIIKNKTYDIRSFYSWTAVYSLKESNTKRKELLRDFIEKSKIEFNKIYKDKLTWVGKPSHLAFIIRSLVDGGYIDAPRNYNNEINHSKLANQVINTFNIRNGGTKNTLSKYLNPESEKHEDLARNFSNHNYYLPLSKLVG